MTMLIMLLLSCRNDVEEPQSTAGFCDLARSIGPSQSAGDVVVLDCNSGNTASECDELDDNFFITDEGTVQAASAACSDENSWWNTTEVVYTATCLDESGDSVDIIKKNCTHAAAL